MTDNLLPIGFSVFALACIAVIFALRIQSAMIEELRTENDYLANRVVTVVPNAAGLCDWDYVRLGP